MDPNATHTRPDAAESRLQVALFVCLGVGLLAMLGSLFVFGRDRAWFGLTMGALTSLSSILVARRITWRIDTIQAVKMRSAARSDNRPPFLVLRSFSRSGLAFRPGNYEDSRIAPGKAYLNDIANALQDMGRLLAIGGPDDTIEMSEKRLLYFQSTESGWRQMFRLASEAARAVIVIPDITQGVLQEVRELTCFGAISKVIVFMPPTPSGFAGKWIVRYSDTEAIAGRWQAVRNEWETIGVSLPAYDKAGMLFALDRSGKSCRASKLNGMVEGPDLTAIRELARTLGGSSAPVSELIFKLESLEAPRKRPSILREVLRLIGLGY